MYSDNLHGILYVSCCNTIAMQYYFMHSQRSVGRRKGGSSIGKEGRRKGMLVKMSCGLELTVTQFHPSHAQV